METLEKCKQKLRALEKGNLYKADVNSCKLNLHHIERQRELPNISAEIEHMEFARMVDILSKWFLETELPNRVSAYLPLLITLLKIK